jgi:alpha-beta hydrolase superfamily lysophospholipase
MEGMPRPAPAPPDELGELDGLAYARFAPAGQPLGGVLILHGAGSAKESHFDFARAARGAGIVAVAFDQRGHGDSEGRFDGRAAADVVAMTRLLPAAAPLALRGSSMGGYLSLLAADEAGAAAVVAICPAPADGLAAGFRDGRFEFRFDAPAVEALLAEHPLEQVMPDLRAELLLMHAEGDERVPIAHSRALAALADPARTRLIEVPGGDHRSVQHDPELQAAALRWLRDAFARAGERGAPRKPDAAT